MGVESQSISQLSDQAVDAGICCAVCQSTEVTDIFEARNQPINVGIVYDDPEQARRAPMADITLSYCRQCGFVFNRRFDHSKVSFEPGYEVALNHSAVFREFISSVIDRLVERYDLREKNICEIGCGAGYFLREICQRGDNHGIGIDPTVPTVGHETLSSGTVQFLREFFGQQHQAIKADFVCSLSVFEDIPQPVEFLTNVRQMIGSRRDVPVYFEVFNAFDAIKRKETWSIHYEQCNYFSLEVLEHIFRRCGFKVTESGTCYQGEQYLYVEALPEKTSALQPEFETIRASGELPPAISEFARLHRQRCEYWQQNLTQWQQENKRVVIWGTGGKGISFLNTLSNQQVIEYAVEINPDKQGKFVVGTAQQIVSPQFLAEYQPDKIIVTNALYLEEMKQQANELGVSSEFLVA